jgi:phosphoenolpyruvate carboxykinase (ATP)
MLSKVTRTLRPSAQLRAALTRHLPAAAAATGARSGTTISKPTLSQADIIKSQLMQQLKTAELKGWTPEEVKAALSMEIGSLGIHAKEISEQINSLSLDVEEIYYNSPAGILYEQALKYEDGSAIVSSGALAVKSGKKTGRSPLDKRIVFEESSADDVWWGKVNIPLDYKSFLTNRERAVDYLNTRRRLYIVDGWGGWDHDYRVPVRVITSRAYHALFMQNMLVVPTKEESEMFMSGKVKPFVILNAGVFPCNRQTEGMTSSTSVAVSFKRREMVILGTQYAGEMKKGVFTIMNYLMPLAPKRDLPPAERALPLHASANIGPDNDVSIFFGLSGTGKTTLSADPKRDLIGDDEHVWHSKGVFNIEGGCYAKTIGLTREKEPEIYDAIRFGSVLENVVWDESTGDVDYDNVSLTENTRVAYPLKFIPNARIPAKVENHPKQVILLTCDAFGVLPPVSKLTRDQVMYHFISGYTAKVAGTEEGVTEPEATFSACFGAPFLVWHPNVYAEMLAAKLDKYGAEAYLINTGWVGGPYGTGKRCSLKYTRALVDAIHDGTLAALPDSEWEDMPIFGLKMPKNDINGVPRDILRPEDAWIKSGRSKEDFRKTAENLAGRFQKNFRDFADRCSQSVRDAGPKASK